MLTRNNPLRQYDHIYEYLVYINIIRTYFTNGLWTVKINVALILILMIQLDPSYVIFHNLEHCWQISTTQYGTTICVTLLQIYMRPTTQGHISSWLYSLYPLCCPKKSAWFCCEITSQIMPIQTGLRIGVTQESSLLRKENKGIIPHCLICPQSSKCHNRHHADVEWQIPSDGRRNGLTWYMHVHHEHEQQ